MALSETAHTFGPNKTNHGGNVSLFPAPPLDQWPSRLLDLYRERVAIMAVEGVADAERKAMADVWGQR